MPGEGADAFVRPRFLTQRQFHIMAVFAVSAGEPLSHKSIARLANCSDRTIKRALPRLVDLGFVEVRHRFMPDGGQLSNAYFVTARGKRALAPNFNIPSRTQAAIGETSLPGP